MNESLPVFKYPNGNIFVAHSLEVPEQVPFPTGTSSDEDLLRIVKQLWDRAYEAARPDQERMRRCSLYYDGLHHELPEDNLSKEMTNYPFSVVETVHPQMVETRPRPEIIPGYGTSTTNAQQLQELATWWMNTAGFDRCHRLATREILKLGWTPVLMTFDHKTGMPYPKPWCNWDFYRDPCAASDDAMMHYFLAGPVHTVVLQSMFPEHAKAGEIRPDNYLSPGYDALIRPHRELYDFSRSRSGSMVTGYAGQDSGFANPTSTPTPPGSTTLTNHGSGYHQHGHTTFLYQLHVRDLTQMTVVYSGKMMRPDGTWHWHYQEQDRQACGSGWRVIQATPRGILGMSPLDSCWGGMNVVIGRDYEQAHRPWSFGEVDQIIPKTRAINRRQNDMSKALSQQVNAPILADLDSGAKFDKSTVRMGDVIKKARGSTIAWMEMKGPSREQFLVMADQRQDIDVTSGVHDVQQGEQVPGLQTGVAINALKDAANTRIRGKEGAMHDFRAAILKKAMSAAGKKLKRRIIYRASSGEFVTLDPSVLLNEFEIQFVPGSGLQSTREAKKNEMFTLFQAGLIDQQAALEAFDVKDREAIVMRMQAAAQQQALLAAAAGPSGPGADK